MAYSDLVVSQSPYYYTKMDTLQGTAGNQFPTWTVQPSGFTGSLANQIGNLTATKAGKWSATGTSYSTNVLNADGPKWYQSTFPLATSYVIDYWLYWDGTANSASGAGGVLYGHGVYNTTSTSGLLGYGATLIRQYNNAVYFYTSNANGNSGGSASTLQLVQNLAVGQWTHFAFSFELVNLASKQYRKKIYKNGVLASDSGVLTWAAAQPYYQTGYLHMPTGCVVQSVQPNYGAFGTGITISDYAMFARFDNVAGPPTGGTEAAILARYNYGASTFRSKYWNGSAWTSPVAEKKWNGTAWVDWGTTQKWNGTAWVNI